MLERGKAGPTPVARLAFQLSGQPKKISVLEPLKGRQCWLILQKLTITAADTEEFLLFSAVDDQLRSIEPEVCERLFDLSARVEGETVPPDTLTQRLDAEAARHAESAQLKSDAAQKQDLLKAQERLDEWADDFVVKEERKLDEMRRQHRVKRKAAREAPTLDAQLQLNRDLQQHDRDLEAQENRIKQVRREAYAKRDQLIDTLTQRLSKQTRLDRLFTVSFVVA